MTISFQKFNKAFDRFFLANFLILAMGIPLLFTSYTRSVFEVNKLLLLRLVILVVYGAWILKSLWLKENKLEAAEKDCYVIFGYRFRRIGLEIPMILWILANLLSIFFAERFFIGMIGSYDRWEGLATMLNYLMLFYMVAKLINNTHYRLIIFFLLLFSTSISSIYGIVQSLGLDFMNWSTSPVSRVFACINNPVHFCAYVAMIVPIGVSITHYLLDPLDEKLSVNNRAHKPILKVFLGLFAFIFYILLYGNEWINFFQFLILSAAACFALSPYRALIPNKAFIIRAGLFIVITGTASFLGVLSLSPIQSLSVLFMACSYFCLSVYDDKSLFLFRLSTVTTLIVYYSMFLSFSRATLLGFAVCMPLFYQLFFLDTQDDKKQFLTVVSLFVANVLLTFSTVFKAQNALFWPDIVVMLLVFVLYAHASKLKIRVDFKTLVHVLVFSSIVILTKFPLPLPFFTLAFLLLLVLYQFKSLLNPKFIYNSFLSFIFILICFFSSNLNFLGLSIILILLLFQYSSVQSADRKLKFHIAVLFTAFVGLVTLSVTPLMIKVFPNTYSQAHLLYPALNLALFLIIANCLYWLYINKGRVLMAVLSALLLFGVIGHSQHFAKDFVPNNEKIRSKSSTAASIANRMNGISEKASGNPRLYMWMSVPPWILDHPVFGSGPDTIRALYPLYRHPKYGDAEGGHNFTPDRLHNEYVNTLVTLGLFGFIVKYIFLFGAWYLILIKLLNKYNHSRKKLILIGSICAPTIYSVQVLFNFGVVATLFLFYFLMGLGLSFVNDEYDETDTETANG